MNLYDHFIHLIYEFVWMHTATRAGGFERLSGGSSWRGYLYPFIPRRRSVRGLRLTPSRSGGSGRRTRYRPRWAAGAGAHSVGKGSPVTDAPTSDPHSPSMSAVYGHSVGSG